MSSKTIIKLGLICAVLFTIWRLWQDDAAINAIILFCTAGVVPGTAVELTPEQVYLVLGGILFLAVMAIFSKQLVRDIRAVRNAWRRRQAGKNIAAVEVTQESIASDAPTEALTTEAPATAVSVVITKPATPGRLALLWRRIRPRLIIAAGVALEAVIMGFSWTAVRLSRASLITFRYGMQAWLWIEPYIRRFDHWLERTLKSNQDVATLLHFGNEFGRVLQTRYTQVRSRWAHLLRTPDE